MWLTGLSGSGKSTLAFELERRLFNEGRDVTVLDGDNVRQGLCADLGFSTEDRAENIRRVAEVAGLFAGAGLICVTSFISPYRVDRARARDSIGDGFHEVHLAASLDVCEARDPKGLYAKARAGKISDFTGIDDPYEAPDAPDLAIDTGALSLPDSLARLHAYAEAAFMKD